MTERKRAGARRSLADAAAPKKPRRPIDDDTAFLSAPEQTELLPAPAPAPAKEVAPAIVKQPRARAGKKPVPTPDPATGIKYTAVLDHDTVDAFDALTRTARRRLGRHVSKLELLSSLLLLAADDPSLRDQLIDSLSHRRHSPPDRQQGGREQSSRPVDEDL